MMEILVVLPVLAYAGYTDFRHGIIGNPVSVLLLLIGLTEIFFPVVFHIPVTERVLIALLAFAVLYLAYRLKPGSAGGGDVKLFSSLGFCLGVHLLPVIILSCIAGIIYWFITKNNKIPMGSAAFLGALLFAVSEKIISLF